MILHHHPHPHPRPHSIVALQIVVPSSKLKTIPGLVQVEFFVLHAQSIYKLEVTYFTFHLKKIFIACLLHSSRYSRSCRYNPI